MNIGNTAISTGLDDDCQAELAGQYLSFKLGGEIYGVDILSVREIKGWEEVRPLPDAPSYVKGVLDLRGVIVPIVDLRIRFQLTDCEYTPTTVTIVLTIECGSQQHVVGAVVDGVSDVLDVSPDEARVAPEMGSDIGSHYIKGMMTSEGRMVILLDVNKLFDPRDMGLPEVL
ncbi:Positive regulator of CheA protein activity (CheW) [hydrothermal vent metagenome]|uniref:Chemotaxis protein CheW n=1 Tax=hydrothermal vent metagenome TaxID=652676 RepID=A0A3B1BN60_9ZZZZ